MTTDTIIPTIDSLRETLGDKRVEFNSAREAFNAYVAEKGTDDLAEVLAMGGKAKTAESAVANAEKAIAAFEANARFEALANVNRGIVRELDKAVKDGLVARVASMTGSISIDDKGTVKVTLRPSLETIARIADVESAISKYVLTNVEQYVSHDAREIELSVKGILEESGMAVAVTPKGTSVKAPRVAKAATNGNGSGGGKRLSYKDPAGKEYTVDEVLTALRDTHSNPSQIDRFLSGEITNGKSNTAKALATKANWTVE